MLLPGLRQFRNHCFCRLFCPNIILAMLIFAYEKLEDCYLYQKNYNCKGVQVCLSSELDEHFFMSPLPSLCTTNSVSVG
jgi:hypothetical protein